MITYNWQTAIGNWVATKKSVQPYHAHLIDFFEMAFLYTACPERAMFGTTKGSVALVVGGIYLAALHKGMILSLLVDREVKGIANTTYGIVKSTKNFQLPLFWLDITDLSVLSVIIANTDIWESYHQASHKILESKISTVYRHSITNEKVLLIDFWQPDAKAAIPILTVQQNEADFQT